MIRKRIKRAKRLIRRVFNDDKAVVQAYFDQHSVRKLHIGAGKNYLADWLNSDYLPTTKRKGIIHLDALKRLPFDDASFDYVFTEHLIEHFSYSDGTRMLAECHRVLKPGGRLRVSTPDLLFLVDLYRKDKSQLQEDYIRWAAKTFIDNAPAGCEDVFVINNMVRDWGHLFIYDEKTLALALAQAGFSEVTRCHLNESLDKELQNLENEKRMPPGFLELESFSVEAVRG